MKYKIVTFIDGIARISITKDITKIKANNVDLFINPDLRKCKDVPPELWEVKNGKIVPIDVNKHKERLYLLHTPTNNYHVDCLNRENRKLKFRNKILKIALVINILAILAICIKNVV